jgi:hypothetical protein
MLTILHYLRIRWKQTMVQYFFSRNVEDKYMHGVLAPRCIWSWYLDHCESLGDCCTGNNTSRYRQHKTMNMEVVPCTLVLLAHNIVPGERRLHVVPTIGYLDHGTWNRISRLNIMPQSHLHSFKQEIAGPLIARIRPHPTEKCSSEIHSKNSFWKATMKSPIQL